MSSASSDIVAGSPSPSPRGEEDPQEGRMAALEMTILALQGRIDSLEMIRHQDMAASKVELEKMGERFAFIQKTLEAVSHQARDLIAGVEVRLLSQLESIVAEVRKCWNTSAFSHL